MLIYFNPASPGKGLYIRKSSRWQRLTTDSLLSSTSNNNWQLTGNSSLTGSERLGPLNAVTLNLITGNTNRLTIDGTGAISLLGNTSLNGTFTLNPATSTTDLSALLLNSGNTVVKRTLNTAAFDGAIQNINGLTASSQTITTSPTSGTLGFTSSVNTHTLTIPDATTGTRGFVNTGTQSFTGDKTFSNNLTVTGTTTLAAANSTTDTIFLMTNLTNSQVQRRNISSLPYIQSINGSSASAQTITTTNTPGTLGFTNSGGTHTLSLPDADASTRGLVNTSTQTIAGNKTFNNNVAVNGTTKIGTNGTPLNGIIRATGTLTGFTLPGIQPTAPALAGDYTFDRNINNTTRTFTITGAAIGATVSVSPSAQLPNNLVIAYCRVSAVNTVEVKFTNTNGMGVNTTITLLTSPRPAPDIVVPTMDLYFTIIQ